LLSQPYILSHILAKSLSDVFVK